MEIKCVYPGTFDPITYGHIDIIRRGREIFDILIVAVADPKDKKPLFTLKERVEMAKQVLANFSGVYVDSFSGLLVDFMKKVKAKVILRGLRAVSDFEYEFQMALMNRKLYPEVETIFMMTSEEYSYLSSRVVREIASYGGCVKDLVPPLVEKKLKEKFKC